MTSEVKSVIGTYRIHDHILEHVNYAKYLGVYIDSNLALDAHVDAILKKSNTPRAFLEKNR